MIFSFQAKYFLDSNKQDKYACHVLVHRDFNFKRNDGEIAFSSHWLVIVTCFRKSKDLAAVYVKQLC